MEVRGRNLVTGLPKTIVVTSDETLEALREPALQIVDAVHNVLERTPPELAADIFDRGIVLTGGGSLSKRSGCPDRGEDWHYHDDCRGSADRSCDRNR